MPMLSRIMGEPCATAYSESWRASTPARSAPPMTMKATQPSCTSRSRALETS